MVSFWGLFYHHGYVASYW